ncbi:MAG: ABC transporter permease [Pseudomonadota bacterium]
MSGSYDKPGSPAPPTYEPLGYDAFERGPVTSPPRPPEPPEPPSGAPPLPPPRDFDVAPSGAHDRANASASAPIVPARSVTGSSLVLVIAIMCFLACLTAGAVYLMNQSASAWVRNIASEVTVQVEVDKETDVAARMRSVNAFLASQPGIQSTTIIPVSTSRALLEPWLGASDALEALPIPRLIAIQIDRNRPPDLDEVRARLSSGFTGVSLDDHRQWQQQIRTVTNSFALGGLAILLLVGAATTAIIVSATRSAMLSNRGIVEVLHFVGATDKFIAREFERHFLSLGIRAGLVGAFAATLAFLAMPTVMGLIGGGTMSMAEVRRIIGSGSLDGQGFIVLGLVVVAISAICMITSRFSVYRILNARDD